MKISILLQSGTVTVYVRTKLQNKPTQQAPARVSEKPRHVRRSSRLRHTAALLDNGAGMKVKKFRRTRLAVFKKTL